MYLEIPEDLLEGKDISSDDVKSELCQQAAEEWDLELKDLEVSIINDVPCIEIHGDSLDKLEQMSENHLYISLPDDLEVDLDNKELVSQILQDCARQLELDVNDLHIAEEGDEQYIEVTGKSLLKLETEHSNDNEAPLQVEE